MCPSTGGGKACTKRELEQLYNRDQFLRIFATLAARDWVLPMYGPPRAFLAPIVDMFNFGQMGIRAQASQPCNPHADPAIRTPQRNPYT